MNLSAAGLKKLLSLFPHLRLRRLRSLLSLAHVRREVDAYRAEGLGLLESAALVAVEFDKLVDWARVASVLGTPRAQVAGFIVEALDGPGWTLAILVAYRLAVRRGVEAAPEGSRPAIPDGDEGPKLLREALLERARSGRAGG